MNIFITCQIPKVAVEKLKEQFQVFQWDRDELIPRDVLLERVKGMDAIFCTLNDKIDEEFILAAGPQLRVVATMSVGIDHINVPLLKSKNILIGNTPQMLTDAVAELTLTLILTVTRNVVENVAAVKEGLWKHWRPEWLLGTQLTHKVVGIFGFGRIGQATAKILQAFGCTIIFYEPHSEVDVDLASLGYNAQQIHDFNDFLARCDILSLHCPLLESTKGIIGKAAFQKMKPTAILVNTSRGPVVNQDDLVEALTKNVIHAAALDVTTPEPLPVNHPLLKLPNCIVFPHVGSATAETRQQMAIATAQNIINGLENKPLLYPL